MNLYVVMVPLFEKLAATLLAARKSPSDPIPGQAPPEAADAVPATPANSVATIVERITAGRCAWRKSLKLIPVSSLRGIPSLAHYEVSDVQAPYFSGTGPPERRLRGWLFFGVGPLPSVFGGRQRRQLVDPEGFPEGLSRDFPGDPLITFRPQKLQLGRESHHAQARPSLWSGLPDSFDSVSAENADRSSMSRGMVRFDQELG